jgi:hypothetical protein
MPLGILRQQASGCIETAFVPDAGKDVGNFALSECGIADAIGGQQRKIKFPRKLYSRLVTRFLVAIEMALQLDIKIFPAKNRDEMLKQSPSCRKAVLLQSMGKRAVFVTRETDQALSMTFEFVQRGGCDFVFGSSQLCCGDKTAEVLVSGTRLHQQGVASAFGKADFRANVGLDSTLLGGKMKARSAVNTISIQQRHGGKAVLRTRERKSFGQGRTIEEGESGTGMEFSVHKQSAERVSKMVNVANTVQNSQA